MGQEGYGTVEKVVPQLATHTVSVLLGGQTSNVSRPNKTANQTKGQITEKQRQTNNKLNQQNPLEVNYTK